jgi:hypothetical protein
MHVFWPLPGRFLGGRFEEGGSSGGRVGVVFMILQCLKEVRLRDNSKFHGYLESW